MVFRFFDLPGEIRNRIYEEALVHPTPNSGTNVALLRTCKKAHKEGKSIFEAENCFTLVVKFSGEDPTAHLSGDIPPIDLPSADVSVLGFTAGLPSSIPLNAARMRVLAQSAWDGPHLKACNRFLFALVSWLNSLPRRPLPLVITFEGLHDPENSLAWTPLYSLLPHYQLVHTVADPNPEITRMFSPSPVQDFLRLAPPHNHIPASLEEWGRAILDGLRMVLTSNRNVLKAGNLVLYHEWLAELQLLEALAQEENLRARFEEFYLWVLQHERQMGSQFLETRMRGMFRVSGENERLTAVMGEVLAWFPSPQEVDEEV